MNKPDYLISTPENVDLHLELAGLGNRIMAAAIDKSLIAAALLVVFLALGVSGFTIERSALLGSNKTLIYFFLIGIAVLAIFVINFGYFIFFEGFWQGQTPGKKMAQIRVIESNGQPVGWSAVFIRNLLRLVDEMPGMFPGIVPMMLDKQERRFGDMAAGTLVIRERLQSFSGSSITLTTGNPEFEIPFDSGQITPEEYGLIVSFLKRRESLLPQHRQQLSADLLQYLRSKIEFEWPSGVTAEAMIEKIYAGYNQRS